MQFTKIYNIKSTQPISKKHMKNYSNFAVSIIFAFILYFPFAAAAQNLDPQWGTLNQEVMILQKSGKYGHAILTSKKAIFIAQEAYQTSNFKNHSNELRTSLAHLASIYKNQGNYAETIPIYKEMLTIWEKIADPNHPDKITMKNLADAYRTQGRYSEAESLYIKSLEAVIEESKTQPINSFYDRFVLSIYEGRAALYWATGRNAEAQAMERHAAQLHSNMK